MLSNLGILSKQRTYPFNTYDVAKLIALLTMVIDHMGYIFYEDELWLRAIGRIAAPIFLFLVGYSGNFRTHTGLIMCGMGLIVVDFALGKSIFPLNILISIALVRLILQWMEKRALLDHVNFQFILPIAVFNLSLSLFVEYGTGCLLIAIAGYYVRQQHDMQKRSLFLALAIANMLLFTGLFWEFTLLQQLSQIVVWAGLYLTFETFRVTNIQTPTSVRAGQKTLTLIARNTLILYVVHLVAFKIIAHDFTESWAIKWF